MTTQEDASSPAGDEAEPIVFPPVRKEALPITLDLAEEPMMRDEPQPTAVADRPTAPATISQRRGCVLLFLGAILGAFFGVTLSLAILLGLNGTLTFTQTDAQLRRAINDSGLRQDEMADSLATRAAEIDALVTRIETLNGQQEGVTGAMTAVSQDMATMAAEGTAVHATLNQLDERVDETEGQLATAAEAAESFQGFLGGLQALLDEVNPVTATPTPSPTPSPTTAANGTKTAVSPTATLLTTRTPQPTRTPLVTATLTARQPSGN